jgi:hypothetical protein
MLQQYGEAPEGGEIALFDVGPDALGEDLDRSLFHRPRR